MSLEVLKCPNCGAPMPADVVEAVVVCDYCGRSVANPAAIAAGAARPARAPAAQPAPAAAQAPAPTAAQPPVKGPEHAAKVPPQQPAMTPVAAPAQAAMTPIDAPTKTASKGGDVPVGKVASKVDAQPGKTPAKADPSAAGGVKVAVKGAAKVAVKGGDEEASVASKSAALWGGAKGAAKGTIKVALPDAADDDEDEDDEDWEWTDENIIAYAQEMMGQHDALFYAPKIPADKLKSARATHRASLERDEQVLVLFDDTVFGGADDGFIVTSERFAWKNIMESPKSFAWGEIDADEVDYSEEGLTVMGETVQISQADGSVMYPALGEFIYEMALEAAEYDDEDEDE